MEDTIVVKMVRMQLAGMGVEEIARQVGFSPEWVRMVAGTDAFAVALEQISRER